MQIEDSYPLSPVQHGMLIHSLSAPQSGVYVQQLVSVLREVLNVSAFRQAWDLMVSRHAILRTSFVWDGADEPLQRVHANVSLPFECHDWSRFPVERREELLKGFLIGDRERGFRFDEAPLMRQTLFRYAEAEYRWIWTSHHALLDGRSRLLLLKELFAAYEEILDGRPTNLNGAQSYRNYIDWLNKNDFTVAEGFWRDLLSGFIAPTPLLPERNRPAENSSRTFGKQTLRLSGQVTRRLQSLAREHQLTPNTFFEGAWALLLSLYSGETDVVFGATRAVRHAAVQGVESMVGLLINTVPVRASVSSETLLLPWLKELRDRWVAMRNFEHTSLVKIQQWSEVPAGKPLFESLLVFENYQLNSLMREQGAHWEKRDFNLLGSTHYPLSMAGYLGQDLVLEITYDHHRFDDAAIARMLGQVKVLLEGMVSDPARRLADLPRMTQEECHQLLVEWNDTKRNYPQDLCLHELFERQTERTPDAIAVVFEEKKINYLELNRRANYVAQRLRELGIGPDVFVGICLERSIEMIVALLGILKAGGAYVPLDPAHPKDRLAFILQDSQAAVLLTEERLLDRLPALTTHVVYMDKEMARELESNPDSQVGEDNCAYVIYTSGSTGNPKGVMVEHRSLVNYLCWFNESPLAERLESLPAITTPTFDASLRQLFAPLLRGGQVWIVPNDIVGEPAALLRTLGARSSVGLNCVPSLWQTVLKAIEADHAIVSDNNLSYLILGGEAFNQRLVKKTFAAFPDIIIWNIYGPTETTANASFAVISPGAPISIGRPISNTRIYIRDAFLEPVPIGVTGELHIGGAGLARGYLNRPDLTSEKFIPDPFSGEPGARLYATGDRARFRPDGSIEFLGRLDGQIKLRGFRIELGDIEATLAEHPSVRQAVVLARDNIRGENELQAYVVPQQDGTPTIKDLRSFLKSKLPDYMIPSAFVFLDTLPLTSNGKVDRRALPAPGRPEPENNFVAPRTAIEEILAGIWSRVLNIKQVGIHDNFFEVGGHSLLATRIISRLHDAFQVELSFSALFESPTVAGLAERIEKARRTEQDPAPSLKPVSRSGTLPLSFAQQRLWFLDQLEPNTSVYNIPSAQRLKGPLDIDALEQSLNEIVRRHEALRTTFSAVEGQPVQRISPSLSLSLPVVDLSHWPENEHEDEARRLSNEEAQRPFDLAQGPLVRATLLRLNDEDHILLLTMHHIVSDGWSMGVFFRELSTLYGAFSKGEPSPLQELAIQYGDIVVWQRNWLQGEVLETQLGYWKKRLDNIQTLQLPTDRPRPAVQSYRGARQSIVLSRELTEALKTLSRQQGVTLFMTLLAAFQTLLYRYTGQCDIVLGAPIAGRTDAKTEELIGFFANTLVLRTDLSGDPTFRVLLKRVRTVALEAYNHQELPFEKVVELVQPERDLSYNPLFQVLFALHNTPPTLLELPGLIVYPMEVDSGTARFDLALDLREQPQGLNGSLEYNTDLFDSATITRMLGHFQTLLECIAADPDRRLSTLSLLTEAERQQVLVEWSGKPIHQARDSCLHELFESHVKRAPDAVAVICEGKQLTYRELNRQANQLAHHLRKLGVQPEVPVGICVERSVQMVVGLLAILKAGGAYVPLDPDYPTERLAYMLEDIQAPVVVTQQHLIERLPERHAAVISLDADWKIIAEESRENLAVRITPENLAYVIYTSGSTGRPKGVQIRHRSVARLLEATRPMFGFDEHDIWTVFHSYAFDFSVWEIWGALLQGGRLVVVPLETAQSPAAFRDLLHRERVTVLNQTPSAMRQLIGETPETLKSAGELNIRLIICGGEAFPRDLASTSLESGVPVWNFYGPTEATVWAAINPITSTGSEGNSIPIGRPMADRQIYLLDRNQQPAPVGVPGELHIGGAGLARGYFKRPELTAEKFIPDPFSNEPGARLYKTGDSARYLPDGTIDFLSRIDNQVKIRGFRIELGEIEAVLAQHPSVREVATLIGEDKPGDKRLICYVVLDQGKTAVIHELRSFLKEKLPDYMVPSDFVLMDTLPLTPNGKVDRRTLPAPDRSRLELYESFSAPRTPTEELLVGIWAEILKLEKVGIHDSFFDLGGHSLLATQVISRVQESSKVELPLRSLFESPTVAGLAERIEESLRGKRGFPVLPILPMPRDGDLPLSFAQQRLWFLDQLEPNTSVYNIPSAQRLKGPLDFGALEQSLNEIVRRHEALRTTFSTVEGQPVQRISPSLSLSLPVVDLSCFPESEREDEARRLTNEEAQRPFDLAHGPFVRATLLRLNDEDHVLLLTMHHIASDGWSMEVLFRELSVLYEAISNGKPSPLESLPIQYADFAVWQREWLQGEVLESQLSYWKKQLEGIPGVLNLPTDHPRPAVQSYRGARRSIELSKELSQGLKALSRKEGVTLFMTLLAAFQTLLYRYTRQEDVVVGSPIANRNRTEIEGLIGFFVNTLALRTNFSDNPTFKELLARVREMALGAYAHQDLPFEKLVEELHPERSVNRTPLFQVLFNMVSQEDAKLDLGGLTVERVSSSSPESKFDLTLYVREQNGKIGLNLVYRADLFSQARMTCFLEQYKYLLEQIVDGPSTPIQSYSLVTPESRELLPDPTAALTEPPQQLITSILSSWAAQTPNQPAISQGGRNWTYSELAERAEILAGILRTSGLERREVVAVYGRRSFGLIVGMVGTLLAGGVLLPIDHALPNQRKQLMLKEARAKKLLYVGNERPDVAWLEGNAPGILVIDPAKGSVVEAGPRLRPEPLSLPELSTDAPAYIFFTSGTTGVPKGVLGCHKSLSHFLTWQRETFAIGPEDRIAQLTGLSFDAALRDIFLPLISGATLCLPEVHDHLASDEIIAWLEREQISVLHTVPSVAQSWLANLTEKISLPSLRWVFFVGEPLSDALVRQWRAAFHNAAEIVNLYGPTETTLVKCFYRVPADMRPGVQPVGRPIPDTQALVFAGNNQLCGINELGEIVLRTPFRSLGYVNAPEENQKRFVKNPFRDDSEDLIYFTGDAGCYQPDGTLEILGRLDDEVKIRGVRIEPAEVTATLARHPLVESCVVVGKKNERHETYLAAYAVASGEEKSTTTELRSYLLQQLPAAMVPTVFVFLNSLPLTPNGKIDRKALPMPDRSRLNLDESFSAPRTPTEELLVGIWAEVLKLEKVGTHDNFFDLGGHSLLATQVVSRIRAAFQVELPLRSLFEKPTVAGLAETIMQSLADNAEPNRTADILTRIESLSDEEAQRLLSDKGT